MVSISQIRASNARIDETHTPRVAVFVGATAGIGRAALTALLSKRLPIKLYIIGRDEANRRSWLEELQQSNPKAEINWLEGQVTLLAEVKRLCLKIKSHEESIDLLFLSAGFLPFDGRHETSEGFETSLALLYWSRILSIHHLLPLLIMSSSTRPKYSPRIINILGTGFESADIPLDDLDLRNPQNFSFQGVVKQAGTLTTLAMTHLAAEPANRNIVFIHNHPGEVKTEILRNGWGVKPAGMPVSAKTGMNPEMSGERSLYLISSAQFSGKGASLLKDVAGGLTVSKTDSGALFLVDEKIECIQQDEVLGKLELRNAKETVWRKMQEMLAPYL
ncbi:uncharacterized protein PAC_18557 [Phialocephala subalpina]|uniref:Uncharacterized protein n=1 Tax=Phialocephala subalpina TaxID=576137 RepID=A0A1L7XUF0_9HELO|nr:uncharacterized protein PAC_18557 [Phialocephala subalpina]